jgi:hypothetical protein
VLVGLLEGDPVYRFWIGAHAQSDEFLQIDALVYELCGLTDEEIRIVEGADS